MKSNSWIVNGVLAVAVIVLYVLHFSSSAAPIKSSALAAGDLRLLILKSTPFKTTMSFLKK